MKKYLIILLAMAHAAVISAQTDDFETNKYGWNEFTAKNAEAIIQKGVMHLESKNDEYANVYAYLPINIERNFEIKCDALVKKIDENNTFGLIFDYFDDYNFSAFIVSEGTAYFYRYENYHLVSRMRADIKLKEQKKAAVTLGIKYTDQRLEFYVNGMKAFERRFQPLQSNGFGFYVAGKQKIDFDNLEMIQ